MDTDNSMVIARGTVWWGRGRTGYREIKADRRRFGLGSEHIIQYTNYVLYNHTPETYTILLTNVTLTNSMKTKKERVCSLDHGSVLPEGS